MFFDDLDFEIRVGAANIDDLPTAVAKDIASDGNFLFRRLAGVDGAEFDHTWLESDVATNVSGNLKLHFAVERFIERYGNGGRVIALKGIRIEGGNDLARFPGFQVVLGDFGRGATATTADADDMQRFDVKIFELESILCLGSARHVAEVVASISLKHLARPFLRRRSRSRD